MPNTLMKGVTLDNRLVLAKEVLELMSKNTLSVSTLLMSRMQSAPSEEITESIIALCHSLNRNLLNAFGIFLLSSFGFCFVFSFIIFYYHVITFLLHISFSS